MKKLFFLLRVDALGVLGVNRLCHGGDRAAKRKAIGALALAAFVAACFAGIAFLYFSMMAGAFAALGALELILGVAAVAGALVTVVTSIVSAPNTLFTFRDFDQVLSLPIPVSTVAFSRLLKLALRNLLFLCVVLIPAGVAYGRSAATGGGFALRYALLTLLAPLLPITAAAALGTLIAKVGLAFRRTNGVRIVLSFLVMLAALALSFNIQPIVEGFSEIGVQLKESLYAAYPPARWFTKAALGDWRAFALFAAVNALPFAAFAWLAARYLRPLHAALAGGAGEKRRAGVVRAASMRHALFLREVRRYFASTIYVTNTAVGALLLIAAGVALLLVDLGSVVQEMGLPVPALASLVPYLAAWMLGMSTTTASSISLEGKGMDQLKVLPIPAAAVFRAKLALHFAVTLPAQAVAATLFTVALKPGISEAVLLYLLPATFAAFAGLAGLWINLMHPKFDWKSETEVVKQGLPTFVTVFGSMLLAGVPLVLTLFGVADAALLGYAFTALCALASLLLWKGLCGKGASRFAAL